MKTILITIAIVFSGMLMQAQTIQKAAYEEFGKTVVHKKLVRLKTDYGTLPAKVKSNGNNISDRVFIKISNDHYLYDSIMCNKGDAQVRVGTIWTDFIYYYEPVETKKFKTMKEAVNYANMHIIKSYDMYKNIKILQDKKKGYYIVGMFIQRKKFEASDPVYFDYNYISIGKVYKFNTI